MSAALKTFVTLLAVCLLGSCGSSPPKRFYALESVPAAHVLPADAHLRIQVTAVNIPAKLDRQEIVRAGALNEIHISDRNRWGAPLADMAQNVLTQDLVRRLPAGRVVLPHAIAPAGSYAITLDILQFESDASGTVALEGGWSLFRLGSDTLLCNQPVHLSDPGAGDHASQVNAMSRLLAQVADEIATALTSDRAHCPGP